MKVAGVAAWNLIAQYAGFFMAILLYMRYYSTLRKRIVWKDIIQKQAMYRFFRVNRDIFFRTLCLVIVTMFLHLSGAAQGEVVLAVKYTADAIVHALLLHHGWIRLCRGSVSRTLYRRKKQTALRNTVNHLFYWGIGLSAAFTLLYAIGGKGFLGLLTNDVSVISASDTYFYWALAIPLTGFSAFLWDGVFIGATATRQMLYSMLVASVSFLLSTMFSTISWEITLYGWLSSLTFH